ncbi:MAG TPA: glucoamylase family protein [Gemmatimonadota bacterium]|nr:glucoamylase family protein [Gemmatimonadota bacterium]
MSRADAAVRACATLRTFRRGEQSVGLDAMGYRGFFYHFLDMKTGRRVQKCELSTIDSAWFLAGALAAGVYFDRDEPVEREVRELADALYRRADWRWAQNGGPTVSHGWKPETGFLKYRWSGYNEALVLYFLGLGSPTHPLPEESYPAWTETYRWKKLYGTEFLYAGPLFIHQLSHVWIDFRGLQDDVMRARGIDYFENSRRATCIQQAYAIRNPRRLRGYGEHVWGITASDGPGPAALEVDGVRRRFYDYVARGVPFGPDDGTIAPWAVVASLPFAPGIVLPTIERIEDDYPEMVSEYGFKCSFNPTFRDGASDRGWISKGYYGLDQGPIVLMIENDRSGFVWRLMERCPSIVEGLRRAGFRGGWLSWATGARGRRPAPKRGKDETWSAPTT